MMIKIAVCLLTLGFLAACESTKTTTKRETLRETNARYASNENASATLKQPAPPAEGPGPTNRSTDPMLSPALIPSPLFRDSAAEGP